MWVEASHNVTTLPSPMVDITNLVFHVTLQEHVIKVLCEFMEGSSLLYTLPNLVAACIASVDI